MLRDNYFLRPKSDVTMTIVLHCCLIQFCPAVKRSCFFLLLLFTVNSDWSLETLSKGM